MERLAGLSPAHPRATFQTWAAGRRSRLMSSHDFRHPTFNLLTDLNPPPAWTFAATVPASLGPKAAAAIGRVLAAAWGGPVGLVAMADLSACRTERAPGAFRPEAAGFDASVAEAMAAGTPARLLDLDPVLAADLLVAGRVPLQVLAGSFEGGPTVAGRVLYDDAPYGVGYLVTLLTRP